MTPRLARGLVAAAVALGIVAVPVTVLAAGGGPRIAATYYPPCTQATLSCHQSRHNSEDVQIRNLQSSVASLASRLGTTPTPTPTKTVTPTPTVTPTVTPTPSSSTAICTVSTLDHAQCGPYASSTIKVGPNDGGPSIRQEVWNPAPELNKQVTTVYAANHWKTVINADTGNTAVNSYPDVANIATTVNNTPAPISGYNSLTSSWAENMHVNANTDAEAAYDIWLANPAPFPQYGYELMIWVDTVKQRPAGTDTGTSITLGGVPYRVWLTSTTKPNPAHSTISLVRANAQTGSIDLLAAIKALVSLGYYPSNVGLNMVAFGFETPSTGGVDETFEVTDYSLAYS